MRWLVTVSTVRREMNTAAQLTFSFVFCTGPQPTIVQLTHRVSLPSSINLIYKLSHNHVSMAMLQPVKLTADSHPHVRNVESS